MLAQERQQYILEFVNQFQSVKVNAIELYFEEKLQHKISLATIRRDLTYLEQQNKLVRVHGGASSLNAEYTIDDKLKWFTPEKKMIAKFVADVYCDKEQIIFLDAGSSVNAIIPYLNKQKCRVVTNGVHHLDMLLAYGISTYLVGGLIKATTMAVVGSIAIKQLLEYQFDLAILGANGIDETFGFSTPDEKEALIKQIVIKQSKTSVVLADASKFNKKSFHQFAKITDVILVTNVIPKQYEEFKNIMVAKGGS